jgi:hypothetical protein
VIDRVIGYCDEHCQRCGFTGPSRDGSERPCPKCAYPMFPPNELIGTPMWLKVLVWAIFALFMAILLSEFVSVMMVAT